jgi:hypothetical protein
VICARSGSLHSKSSRLYNVLGLSLLAQRPLTSAVQHSRTVRSPKTPTVPRKGRRSGAVSEQLAGSYCRRKSAAYGTTSCTLYSPSAEMIQLSGRVEGLRGLSGYQQFRSYRMKFSTPFQFAPSHCDIRKFRLPLARHIKARALF